jgi:hypothetical protein
VTEPVPPLAVAVNVAESPGQTSALFAETVGFGLTVRQPELEPVQPLVSVTVTE